MDFQVVVLAGGASAKLAPLVSKEVPKPLLPVANRPVLSYVLELLEASNLKDLIVVVEGKDAALKVGGWISSAYVDRLHVESIPGVPRIKDSYNPATWMMEVTSTSVEMQLGIDFAQIYRESDLYRDNKELVKQLRNSPAGSKDLNFPSRFPQNGWEQFKACLWKQYLSYWRSPSYNLMRIKFVFISSIAVAVLFWKHGKRLNNQQDLFSMLGSMYITTIFLGAYSCTSVLPYISTERVVLYREKFAGMYSSWAYSFAQVCIEIPYAILQVVLVMVITYPTIGYYWSAYKCLWFFGTMLCILLSYIYFGMLLVSLTPNIQMASILSSFYFNITNLVSGFIIPGPQIPQWWRWALYTNPVYWTLNALFTSQYGDVDKEIQTFEETKSVAYFLQDYFGYHHDRLGLVVVVVVAFPLIYASLFAYFIGKLNFQRR